MGGQGREEKRRKKVKRIKFTTSTALDRITRSDVPNSRKKLFFSFEMNRKPDHSNA